MKYARIADLIFGAPLAIEPTKLDAILWAVRDRFELDLGPGDFSQTSAIAAPADRRPYEVQDGVAVINVMGSLTQRNLGLQALSGMTSYAQIAAEVDQACADPDVSKILLRIDSSGGAAAGAFDLADHLRAATDVKPIIALAEDKALSAGYLIACAASEVYLTQSGELGSIGVIQPRLDESKADAAAGRKVTLIHAGARKVDGQPSQPITDDELAAIQSSVNNTYDLFAGKVAAFRGMTVDAVKATEAGKFQGQKAVDAGLADGVASYESLMQSLASTATRPLMSSSAGIVPTLSSPAPSGKQEVRMDLTKKGPGDGVGEVTDLAAFKQRLEALESENAKLKAKAELDLAASSAKAKSDVIQKHQNRGAIVPAMLTAVNKLSEVMSASELDAALAAYPAHPAFAKADVKVAEAGIVLAEKLAAAGPDAYQLDAEAKELAEKFGWSEKTLEAYDGIQKVQMTERGAIAIYKSGKTALLKDLNAGRA